MKNKISFLILPILVLSLICISAIPPVQTTLTDNGLQIAYPQYQYVPPNVLFNLSIHVYNTSQYFTGTQATCFLDLYSPSGTELMHGTMTAGTSDYFIPVGANNFSVYGQHSFVIQCNSTLQTGFANGVFAVTPQGKEPADVGQMGVGILYFFIMLSAIFIFLGYLFIKNDSVWITYTGLFMMILGFGFIYYDLHLSNLYATTIAMNSGAGNVTTGAFVIVSNFLKLAPYIVAGVIAFFSIKLFLATVKKKNSSDGYDGDN